MMISNIFFKNLHTYIVRIIQRLDDRIKIPIKIIFSLFSRILLYIVITFLKIINYKFSNFKFTIREKSYSLI